MGALHRMISHVTYQTTFLFPSSAKATRNMTQLSKVRSGARSSIREATGTKCSTKSMTSVVSLPPHVPSDVVTFRSNLCEWYTKHQRDLPWRASGTSAYGIWVSEVMSQQTKIQTVIPYWLRWMERFPTVPSLAAATIQDVHTMWTGLGFYRRATALHQGAQYMMENHDGCVPQAYEELLKVPGVGPYTAAAISSMAYHRPHAAVDGNVLRVYARILGLENCDLFERDVQKTIHHVAQHCLDANHPTIWNQAVMELGATVCTSPNEPSCSTCPVQAHCRAYTLQREGSILRISGTIPRLSKKKLDKREDETTALVFLTPAQKVLMERRPPGGLLEHLWCFPMLEGLKKDVHSISSSIRCTYLPSFDLRQKYWREKMFYCGTLVHIFSHIRLEVAIHVIVVPDTETLLPTPASPIVEPKALVDVEDLSKDAPIEFSQLNVRTSSTKRESKRPRRTNDDSTDVESLITKETLGATTQWVSFEDVSQQATSTLARKIFDRARKSYEAQRNLFVKRSPDVKKE